MPKLHTLVQVLIRDKNRCALTSGLDSDVVISTNQAVGPRPRPRPRIVALHAACANIVHMAGARGHFELFRDPEQIRVVTDDDAFYKLIGTLARLQVGPAT